MPCTNFLYYLHYGRGTVGDVFIVLHIDGKAGIHRDGLHLYSKINIDYTEAILGTVIKVIQALSLSVSEGVQEWRKLTLHCIIKLSSCL